MRAGVAGIAMWLSTMAGVESVSMHHPAPAASDPQVEAAALKTFGSMGKERQVLERGREVEPFRREAPAC